MELFHEKRGGKRNREKDWWYIERQTNRKRERERE